MIMRLQQSAEVCSAGLAACMSMPHALQVAQACFTIEHYPNSVYETAHTYLYCSNAVL